VSAELVGKQLMTLGGVTNAVGVPYKGTAPMMNDLLGGHIHMALISAALAVPFDADGRAKALALGSPARYPRLPRTPTFTEAGFAVQGNTWYGLMVRQGTPDAAFNTIVEGVKKVSTQADVLAAIDSQGGVPVFNSPEEFGREIQQELQFITPLGDKYLARSAGSKP
jgi:tripartite-type tricarboxylate transporter receptor subunit TctC